MEVYLYTENFDTQSFDFAIYNNGRLRSLQGQRLQAEIKLASKIECPHDIDPQTGFVVYANSSIRLSFASFKLLINETSPSGRGRLIFGHSAKKFLTEMIKPAEIVSAIDAFTAEKSLSIPDTRKSAFRSELETKLKNRKKW